MEKEFDLSKRIIILPDSNDLDDELKTAPILRRRDVKEFINQIETIVLNKDLTNTQKVYTIRRIAGKDLI